TDDRGRRGDDDDRYPPRRPHDPRQARGREATHVLQGSRRRGAPPRPRARPKRRTPVMRVRGDGSVFRRGRFWHYVFWLDGEPHQGSTLVPVDPTADGVDEDRARRVLAAKREAARRGDEVPHEDRLTLADLRELLRENYAFKQNRSTATMLATFKHPTAYFGERT